MEIFVRCGEIELNTCDWSLLFICKFCQQKIEKFHSFLQHAVKQHLLLNKDNDDKNVDVKLQKVQENAKKSLETTIVTNNACNDEFPDYGPGLVENEIANSFEQSFKSSNTNDSNKQQRNNDNNSPYEIESPNFDDEQHDDEDTQNSVDSVDHEHNKLLTQIYNNEDSSSSQSTAEELNEGHSDEEKSTAQKCKNAQNVTQPSRTQNSGQCPFCQKRIRGPRNLQSHINSQHLKVKPFACNICEQTFADHNNLNVHKRRHLGIKKHLCSLCGHSFVTSTELILHMRHHTQEKPFKCSECSSTFSTSSTLCEHKRRHRNIRPFECEFCDKRFLRKDGLIAHTRTHTKERPFECSMCDAKFSCTKSLQQHMNLHSGHRPYECQYCNATFAQYAGLFGHKKSCREKRKQQANQLEIANRDKE